MNDNLGQDWLMSKHTKRLTGSFAPSAITPERLPPRQRWNHRYATLPLHARLKPTPFVISCLPKLPVCGRALDVAAGAGRHTIALARRGLQVDAVDISWQGLQLARQRASEAQLSPEAQVNFIVADLERPWLPRCHYDVVLVSFFLHRPLFPLIKERLLPGGRLIYETYTVEQKELSYARSMRRKFLLEHGELRRAFSDFEILFYDEGNHNDKATAQLLAEKPA